MADLRYYKLWADSIELVRRLDFDEIGRLFWGILSMLNGDDDLDGIFEGRESIVFPVFQAQFERDKAEYAKICAKNRGNAAKRYATDDSTDRQSH